MSAFDVVIRDGKSERLVVIVAGSKREAEGKLRGFYRHDNKPPEIVSMTKQPHSKTAKTIPPHIAEYVEKL